jgi:hypothetical protein
MMEMKMRETLHYPLNAYKGMLPQPAEAKKLSLLILLSFQALNP